MDKDIAKIPDQRMRHMLIKQAEYFRKRSIEKTEVSLMKKRIKEVEKNHSLAWNTENEVNRFFDELDFDIFKMDNFYELNKSIFKSSFLFDSEVLRDEILMEIQF